MPRCQLCRMRLNVPVTEDSCPSHLTLYQLRHELHAKMSGLSCATECVGRSWSSAVQAQPVNYYIRHFPLSTDNSFADALEWFAELKVGLYFRKNWLLLTLGFFICRQSSLTRVTLSSTSPNSFMACQWYFLSFRAL